MREIKVKGAQFASGLEKSHLEDIEKRERKALGGELNRNNAHAKSRTRRLQAMESFVPK